MTTEAQRTYHRNYMHSYYHSEHGKKQRERVTERNKEFIINYLKEHPCVDCGITDIRVLEFDHVTGVKEGNVSEMIYAYSLATLADEIAKCEVRCANCHTIKHDLTAWRVTGIKGKGITGLIK